MDCRDNNSRTVGQMEKCPIEQIFNSMGEIQKTSAKIRAELKNCCKICFVNNSRTVGRTDKCRQEQMFASMRQVRKTSAKIRAELKNCCKIVV